MNKTLQFEDRDYMLIFNEYEWRAGAGMAVRLTEIFHMDGNITRLWGVMSGEEHFREALPEEAEQLSNAIRV